VNFVQNSVQEFGGFTTVTNPSKEQTMKPLTTLRATLMGAFTLLLFWSLNALAATPLVDVEWVKANIGKPGIVLLDLQPAADYLRGHIPGAVNTNFDKDGWREERARDKVPDMLPEDLNKLAALIGRLGIDNKTHVVIVPPGQNYGDVGWPPASTGPSRCWAMMRCPSSMAA
jgi:thiosulfate/3-mercaptopyruvate sulfurtransferase